MAIKRIEGDGRWIETADNEKDAHELHEKHGPALQKHGAEDFQKKFLRDQSEGFERMRTPDGVDTFMRRDRISQAESSGYTLAPTHSTSFIVPTLPWQPSRKPKWGRTVYKYDREADRMMEVP